MKKTLGGDRLGNGKRMKVELKAYERSTHDLGYVCRTTMSAGTLVPFMSELALPGDTWDLDLGCDIKTHPTIGPLFGSYKVQLDVFLAPIRLYQKLLQNNTVKIGLNISTVKLPLVQLYASPIPVDVPDFSNSQINQSSIMAYLGIRGIGYAESIDTARDFLFVPWMMYWDCYKNYYANQQEEEGAVIHTPYMGAIPDGTITQIEIESTLGSETLPEAPTTGLVVGTTAQTIKITYTGSSPSTNLNQVMINLSGGGQKSVAELGTELSDSGTEIVVDITSAFTAINWSYATQNQPQYGPIEITRFPLENIDTVREEILSQAKSSPFYINTNPIAPFGLCIEENQKSLLNSQEGLGLKTYQSDMLNNWLNTEWIDGTNGINEVTAIDVSEGLLYMDSLILQRKIYDMLNRIGVSGGTYQDWVEVSYDHITKWQCTTPMYMGGLIKELIFQEVISTADSVAEGTTQPLGTLAGKGVMSGKHKGGKVTIKADEPSWILGIISLTPRLDYSQGNKWNVHLKTLGDVHVPGLDQIGFQELIEEQMSWSTTSHILPAGWTKKSAGKQVAWLNYTTNVNQTYGNFAVKDNEMFMTLNRRYNIDPATGNITDLTAYIDPSLFNHIFAQTSLDSQNFWANIGIDATVRRKMSARMMPNL